MDTKEREALFEALLDGRLPDENGRFGPFGGRYVPETLMPAIERLMHGVRHILPSPEFQAALTREQRSWIGRPTALTPVPSLSARWGAQVWLKREDLAHTGAHKINNGIGQALLAKALGAQRVVAETGAGQHGVASAAACARVGLPCTVYMGEVDVARQAPNVDRMEHVPPSRHGRFYGAQRYTLNLTRRAMRQSGHSPSIRLFEAAACGVPIISDPWPGLNEFFTPGEEIFVSRSTRETLDVLVDVPEATRRAVAARARARVLAEHTAAHRAVQLESYMAGA